MKWLGVEGISARYKISPHTTYKLVQRGLIPFGRVGRKLVFNTDECDEWARLRGSAGQLDFPVGEEKGEQVAREQEVAWISSEIMASM